MVFKPICCVCGQEIRPWHLFYRPAPGQHVCIPCSEKEDPEEKERTSDGPMYDPSHEINRGYLKRCAVHWQAALCTPAFLRLEGVHPADTAYCLDCHGTFLRASLRRFTPDFDRDRLGGLIGPGYKPAAPGVGYVPEDDPFVGIETGKPDPVLRLKLEVTADDIAHGVPQKCGECPVALAGIRATGRGCEAYTELSVFDVNGDDIEFKGNLPQVARDFIYRFDEEDPVEAFSVPVELYPVDVWYRMNSENQ